MERAWKQILVALTLGVLVPRILLSIVGILLPPGKTSNPTLPPNETTEQTGPAVERPAYLSVKTDSGEHMVLTWDAYVTGVVLAEMPASFSQEALKAQAVVARTYTLRRWMTAWRHESSAVCTDPGCCQDYISPEAYLLEKRGSAQDVAAVKAAVSATAELVITYDGEPIEATYFSCSGGRTEDAVAVWGEQIPYLQSVSSPGEEQAKTFLTEVWFSSEKFASCLGRMLQGEPESWLGEVSYTNGGGVEGIYIGGLYYTGVELRQLLGLNSTAFTIAVHEEGIFIQTRGHGHRVGMSQYGAEAMALAGQKFEAILQHYYPGTRIDKTEALE